MSRQAALMLVASLLPFISPVSAADLREGMQMSDARSASRPDHARRAGNAFVFWS
jgi:hypothetical protein